MAYRLTSSVIVVRVRELDCELVAGYTQLRDRARFGCYFVPSRPSRGVLDPGHKPVVLVVSQCLFCLCNVTDGVEALVTAKEEWDLSAVGRRVDGKAFCMLAEKSLSGRPQ
jgi:hypothetical protein